MPCAKTNALALDLDAPSILRSAELSECGRYRYLLSREWCQPGVTRRMCFVMFNPSTADGEVDDPTIRRCIGFAKRENCGAIDVVNLFAYRSADPSVIQNEAQFIGNPANDLHIRNALDEADFIVAAWGASALTLKRAAAIREFVEHTDTVRCLGTTKKGFPRHPLYVPGDQSFVPFMLP